MGDESPTGSVLPGGNLHAHMSQAGTLWDGEVVCGQGPCQASSVSGAETQMAWQENDGKLGAGPLDDCAGTQGT